MASKDYSIPSLDLVNLVPQHLRNPMVTSLIDNLFNRFLTKDEAVPLYGYVGRRPAAAEDRTPRVPQATVERDVNGLVPVLSFKVGAEVHSFTVQDLTRKAMVLGASSDQSTWLYSQGNNYIPPIDLDRFTNFFNYYWVAGALPSAPTLAWNPTLAPEYYVIAQPELTDLDKLNVAMATTSQIVLTGSGFWAQTWTVSFSSSTAFTVTASGPGLLPAEQVQAYTLPTVVAEASDTYTVSFNVTGATEPLLTFKVVRDPIYDGDGVWIGNEGFAAGDQFTIVAPFISSTYSVTPNVGPGIKGKLTAVNALDQYQVIDGVTIKENDRILVKNQGTTAENGIYIVRPGTLTRAPDFSGASELAGARTFVRGGSVNGGRLFTASAPSWVWAVVPGASMSNTSDWQEANYWVHSSELSGLGLDAAAVVQATRPIIEYRADLTLNRRFDANGPVGAGGTLYEQRKTELNQVPLFDLYRYDGTHARRASALFYYVEDPTAALDSALQRRVKHAANESADFIFEHGLLDPDGGLLFYRTAADTLHTIWHPGYATATVVDQAFKGAGGGTLTAAVVDPFTAQQVWTFTATSPTAFAVAGSKLTTLPAPHDTVTVGVPYANGLLSVLITAGGTPFEAGDVFTVRVGNLETTRYVHRDGNGEVSDLYGGPSLDIGEVGAWQVPRTFYTNVAASNGAEVPEGTLYSHFRGVLANQLEGRPLDPAFGGSIKLWSEQQNLLAALLMQRDVTPPSLVDMAQRQYEAGLNALVDLYLRGLVQYLGDHELVETSADVNELLDTLLAVRQLDQDVRTVLYDSTSPVPGLPITLPALGATPATAPGVVFDNELGVTLLRHHDGHLSPLYVFTQELRDRLLSPGLLIRRSDGALTPAVGSFTATAPSTPYKGTLWFHPNGVLYVFDVLADTAVAPAPEAVGDHWYHRAVDQLMVWDGGLWQPELDPLAPWTAFDPAAVLNQLLLTVEQRLYDGLNLEQRTYFSGADVAAAVTGPLATQLAGELASWAALNGYDPLAPDYVSTDAFTWNYSSLSMPARWYNALQAHQAGVTGVLPTSRPNLEPWRLLGNAVKPSGWDALYEAPVTPSDLDDPLNGYLLGATAKVVLYSTTPTSTLLVGTPAVDGRALVSGDVVLLVCEAAAANNGLWVVSAGPWSRAPVPLVNKTVVSVSEGAQYAGTRWVLMSTVVTVNVDPAPFEQVRLWTPAMWQAIQVARPTLKLSVDPTRDALLPPYVNAALPYAAHALTNALPLDPAAPYAFGEGSPVETVWVRSVEYRYALVRALYRKDPLAWLGHLWGFEWVEVDGILYDGLDMAVPGHPRFRLHGEPLAPIERRAPFTLAGVVGPAAVELRVRHDGYTATRAQSFSVRTADGTLIGYLHEGAVGTVAGQGYTLSSALIEDEGRPFRVGDTFTVRANADGSGLQVTFDPIAYLQYHGLGQVFTQALRDGAVDTTQGYAMAAFRGWDVNLGYRAGGLVSTDDLRVSTDAGTLPSSAYVLRFKRSPYADDLWVQGLRVSVVRMGQAVAAPTAGFTPATDGSDWVFRVDGYNARYLGLTHYTYDVGDEVTFQALGGAHTSREWLHPTKVSGAVSTQLPLVITGLQQVVNLLFGYSQYLEDRGWRFSDEDGGNVDAETGRVRNWQLEIEKLIDRVYAGVELGQGHVLVPFMDRIWLDQPTGLLSRFYDTSLFDVAGHPGVFDTLGVKVGTDALTVLRRRGRSQISATVPMFSVHAQVDEYEHLLVFNNLAAPSTGEGLIYDPFSGARIATVKLNGRRQAANTLRPEFGGHYLVGDEVRRNLQASVDKVATYYDADRVFEDELSTRHALALLGFSPKGYMSDLDLTERTQFNFWRGLIQMKGTNASIEAFLNNNRFQDAQLDEYWAYKVAEYGDSRPKAFPELKLTVADTVQQFTKLQFDAVTPLPDFTQVSADDETRWFSLDDLNGDTHFQAELVGTYERVVTSGELITLPFIADALEVSGATATLVNSRTLLTTGAGSLKVLGYGPSTPRFNPIKLFNYVDAELVEEIPLWHPANGQHAPQAIEGVNIISKLDPARYNASTQVLGNTSYDPLHAWGAREVGRVWWDTTNLDYVPYYDRVIFTTTDERLNRWGTLADYASVDVVEWVESSVPPGAYDAQALLDAGNADLDPRTRADGQVHGAKTYARDRLWQVRPIAWSHAGVAAAAAHPAFNGAYASNLRLPGSGLAVLATGTFAALGIVDGMRLGAWQEDATATRPLSELLVTGAFTKEVEYPGAPPVDVALTVQVHTDVVGQLSLSVETTTVPILDDEGVLIGTETRSFVRATEVDSGESDVVLIRADTEPDFTLSTAQQFHFDLAGFGLRITLSMAAGTYLVSVPATTIVTALSGTTLYDAVGVTEVCPLSDPAGLVVNAAELSNDVNDPAHGVNGGVGWRAWSVPTQLELDADARVPNGTWRPYVGEFTAVSSSLAVIQDTAAAFTLNNGTTVERYRTDWTPWVELKGVQLRATATADMDLSFTVAAGVGLDRLSVYLNGVAQLVGTYTLVGQTLIVLNVPAGSEAVVVVRAYAPTTHELAFDPDVAEDVTVQRQYKVDYQYVAVPVRDSTGAVGSTRYYFWVKGRATPARGKGLSVKAIAQLLVRGPSSYLVFQHVSASAPWYYDAVAISGLSYVVTKDDSFKLRFTRNFTLRDDPNELDLKDTHTEWALIRPGQRTRIPEALWVKLVSSACGQDAAGNPLPAPRRVAYDERNGTRTRYGFGTDQVLAPSELITSTMQFTILNTRLVDDTGTVPVPDYMTFLDFNESDTWFSDAASTRSTLTRIWTLGKVAQINELFFAVLEDLCAANYELSDIFKTSRLSAYSVRVVTPASPAPTFE